MEPVKTTVRRHFYHVLSNYITITLGSRLPRSRLRRLSDFLSACTHLLLLLNTRQLASAAAFIRTGWPGAANRPHAVNRRMQLLVSSVQNTGPRYRASYRIQGRTQYSKYYYYTLF